MRKCRFITVGLGPVGRRLAEALQDAGHRPVAFVGRRRKLESIWARRMGAKLYSELPEDIDNIDLIITTIPTSKLAAYSRSLAGRSLPWKKLTFMHASGSLGIAPFAPLAKLGAGVAAMHPYQTFPRQQGVVNLRGITYGISGNRKGAALARRIARDLGGHPVMIREDDRMLYHLSAIVACTFLASNVETAVKVLKSLGMSDKRALHAVLPISEETIRNITELGIGAAMTGPQSRGDRELIRHHLRELRKRLPELEDMYRAVSEMIMRPSAVKTRKKSS